jgi:hypothetical protein
VRALSYAATALAAISNTSAGLWGESATGRGAVAHTTGGSTNAVLATLEMTRNIPGTPLAGYGARFLTSLKTQTTNYTDAAYMDVVWSDPIHASRTTYMAWSLVYNGTIAEKMRLTGQGVLTVGGSTVLTAATGQALDADLTAIAALAGTSGLLKKTGAGAWSLDTSIYQLVDTDLTAISALAGTSGLLKKTGAGAWALDTSTYALANGSNATGSWNINVSGSAGSAGFATTSGQANTLASGATPSLGITTITGDGANTANFSGGSGVGRLNFSANGSARMTLFWSATVTNFWCTGANTDVFTIDHVNGRVGVRNSAPSYDLQLGRDSAGKPGSSGWAVTSDLRSKDAASIRPFGLGLAQLRALPRPVFYRYNGLNGLPTDTEYVGYIAQDLRAVRPSMVREGSDGLLFNDYHELVFIAQNAIIELAGTVEHQAARIDALTEDLRLLRTSN